MCLLQNQKRDFWRSHKSEKEDQGLISYEVSPPKLLVPDISQEKWHDMLSQVMETRGPETIEGRIGLSHPFAQLDARMDSLANQVNLYFTTLLY